MNNIFLKLDYEYHENSLFLTIELNGEKLYFNTTSLNRARDIFNANKDLNVYDPFIQINEFLKTVDFNRSVKIFEVYKECKNLIEYKSNNLSIMSIELLHKLNESYNIVNIDDVHSYLLYNNKLYQIPILNEEYQHNDINATTVDKTYVRYQYLELMGLSVYSKLFLPLWQSLIIMIKDNVSDAKELECLNTLPDGFINHRAYVKLSDYVCANIESLKPEDFAVSVLQGYSKDEYANKILAKILIKRLVIANLTPTDVQTNNLVTITHSNINNIITSPGTNKLDNKSVISKKVNNIDSEVETGSADSASRIESYRITQGIADGIIIRNEHYLKDPKKLASQLDENFDEELLRICVENAHLKMSNVQIAYSHCIMASMILGNIIGTDIIYSINKKSIINILAVIQAYLWKMGRRKSEILKVAALFTSGQMDKNSDNTNITRTRLKSTQLMLLDVIFPYVDKKNDDDIKENEVSKDIKSLNEIISQYDWILYAPTQLINEIGGTNVYRVQSNFNNVVTDIIIIHNLKWLRNIIDKYGINQRLNITNEVINSYKEYETLMFT